ncbi:hypothetical protein [Roseimaritima ulvae]|uniref:Zinc finger/thioredoxin putative domain-containing protein n=1 Tax=Roseimaritima ulvae TaxID=980254 RepID=A0A5B9R2I1_9BACT|nr:hypothetical protein [Roseimaritima ulvae]QEG40513.1 hypothetical protein UC8_25270 [Roseimaritima ulvae]
MPISIRCSGCSRTINAPDHAAGKRVKCPACATVLSVPASQPAAAAQPAAVAPPAAVPSVPAFSPFGPNKEVDDSVLTDSDFQTFNPAAPRVKTGTDIPQAKKKQKRPASYYKLPGILGIGAASLNILAAVGLIVMLIIAIVGVAVSGEQGIAAIIAILCLRLFLFAGFTIAGNVHAIVACLNLIHMTSRGASQLSIGEFILNPVCYGLLMFFGGGWVFGLVTMGIFALWNWPCAVWIAIAITGDQAKLDFEEVDDDELEELAAELQRRAAMKEGGGH